MDYEGLGNGALGEEASVRSKESLAKKGGVIG